MHFEIRYGEYGSILSSPSYRTLSKHFTL